MIQDTNKTLGIWFPCIKAGTGSDMYTIRLVAALNKRGVKAEITWLPHHAEYLPWLVKAPTPPSWVTHVHINSWLHKKFIPSNLPIIVTSHLCVHDSVFNQYKSLLQRVYHAFWVKYCERNAFKRASKVTAVSQYTAKQNKRYLGVKNITAIHNWIDTDVFIPAEKQKKDNKFKLLFVGNLSRRKGSDLLPEIMSQLGEQYELYFTGKTEFYSDTNLPVNMLPLGEVRNQKELINLYQQSDAMLFPSRLEGLSLAAIEAQACGLPIIANNTSSMPEVVSDGVTGFLCQQDNVEAFVNKIKKLYGSPNLAQRVGSNAREHAQLSFNEDSQIKKHIELYNVT